MNATLQGPIAGDLNCWVSQGRKMTADRQRRIERAKKWKFDTIAVHGVYDAQEALATNHGSIMEPVYLSTAQVYHNSAEMEASLSYQMPSWCYSRIANPTTLYLEETAALLESYDTGLSASCVATGSGMSAVRTATDPFLVVDTTLPPMNIVTSAKVYGGTFQQFSVRRQLEQGIEVRWIKNNMDLAEWESQIDAGTRFVFGEFPSNPSVDLFDIEKVAAMAHAAHCPLIVDATCASPAITRPLAYGADIVVQSASKVIGASGTTIAGLVTSKKDITSKVGPDEMKTDFAIWTKLWPFRDNGPAIHPMGAMMTLNDMRSLRGRTAQMSRTALEVAEFLEQHKRIDRVHYPGLPSHPAHNLARKYMKTADSNEHAFGYLMSAEIRESRAGANDNARVFYDSLDMTYRATDLGRVKTVATLNAISTHLQQGEEGRELASLRPNNCRISVGLEDPVDIIADLDQALAKI